MIACLGMTNPMYEYLLIPMLLFAIGYLAGHLAERWASSGAGCPCCSAWNQLPPDEMEASHIRILGPDQPAPYDWAKEDGDE